jgi:hypothetical protein
MNRLKAKLPIQFQRIPMSPSRSTFRGNKAGLPSKPCAGCGLPMVWRKRWARNWEAVRHCSDACRRGRTTGLSGG